MAYPPISNLPSPPSRQDPANFADEADAFLGALPTFQSEVNGAGDYFDSQNTIATTQAGIATTQAGNAATSASSAVAAATAAEAASGAELWVSGTTYAVGDNVYSPSTFFTYRSKSAFTSTTDPASDTTNWVLVGVGGTALLSVTNTTATQDQTAFTGSYTAGAVVVTLNGVILTDTTDYTATDGTNVTLATGADAGDEVGIIGFPTFVVANTLALSGGTLTGALAGTTASFSGAVSGASVAATGAVSGASVAATGAVSGASGDISGEFIADSYNETFVTLTAAATVDVDCETGNVFALTTDQNTTFTFSNPPASGTAYGFMLRLTAGGTHTITYPASVDWAGATAPDAPDSGETDVLVFTTTDGGTTWYGALAIDAAG